MNYCSQCGAPVALQIPPGDDRPRYVCNRCDTVHYRNPKLVVGCIPVWEDKVLLCRRAIKPRKGLWTLPAGYLETGETVAQGARRETLEETGAAVDDLLPFLLVDIVHINQIYFMFRSRLREPVFHPTAESSAVVLMREAEVPWEKIAFMVVEKTLRHYFQDVATGRFPFRLDQITPDHLTRAHRSE